MKWPRQLIRGIFKKRYKRFFADFELNNQLETAHCPNTGSMKSCIYPDSPCLVSAATDPNRKLRWTLEAIQAPSGTWVGVNTGLPNKLLQEAFNSKTYSHWQNFDLFKSEVKVNSETRLDACLENSKTGKKHFIEVKNVTLAEGDRALFPDAVTERGQKHLSELMLLIEQGHEAEIFFTVQRSDVKAFSPADQIDPEYGKLLRQAQKKGVVLSAYVVDVNEQEITLTTKKLDLIL